MTMANIGTIVFKGKFGTKYHFNVCSFDMEFKAIGAVYFITKRTIKEDGSKSHSSIYVGQTEDLSQRLDDHHKADCFKIMKANCICIHEESDEERRLDIEKDLVANYSPPCNG